MHKKCPYLSTALECFAGSFGTIQCLDHKFHSCCEFKNAADNKSAKKLVENLVQINF